MHGVVSLLDTKHHQLVKDLWFNWEITVNNIGLVYDSISAPFRTTMLGDVLVSFRAQRASNPPA